MYMNSPNNELTKRIEELEKMLQAKEQEVQQLKNIFLSRINHGIRTPMNSILGFSNLLADESLTKDQRDLYISYINNSSDQLISLIENLTNISMLESGQIKINKNICPLYEMFDEIYDKFNKLKHRKGKQSVALLVTRGINEKDFAIISDRYRLEQVVSNLVEFALRQTEKGVIEFGYMLKDVDRMEFFVRYSGRITGLENHPNIFESVRSLADDVDMHAEGTGISLAIARDLVTLMGGEIRLEIKDMRTSAFIWTLPLNSPPAENIKKIEQDNRDENLRMTNRNIAI